MGNTDKFEMIADRYDTPERVEIAKESAAAIREYLVEAKSKSAIDFGCGTGLVGMNLLNEFDSMLFLDTSQGMIEQIKQKIAGSNLQKATTLCFDFEKDSLAGLHADYIFMAQVLLHIPDVGLVLSRLYEVLKEGGHLLIVDFDKNEKVVSDQVHNGFEQTELVELMTEIGYRKIQTRTFYTGAKFMGQDASLFILDSQKL
ncbi:ubiquinone/menaquinone biosynthesis C-methylase UbiE [Desulfitobacterium sp. LBE]|uniref:Methyltransferase type 12 domain-containing protein n=5 Tax=root TaxID=1 RepID=Q24R47_DESHY|nr:MULTISPECIES: class I SAM-dependent methyltransferase [Desulfitobacterium]ACL19695.1 Methyltransferase type 12 [Desulfitobacterium hafniense DCB-2]EHL08310.1 methyltransferase domain protein [Desulfitobacterium hafniense DP7]KTE89623.1 methyltransferase type 12 [Desulfitobacterium hafniense]MEA5024447.1 class I SAM-dependent methyltransferase [Desulfitobacterium hafniense]TWH57456.1 ubiquinone/menaquinone biosynthesis C-methylase UbiE [Desulfitobacterium sp. LBE]